METVEYIEIDYTFSVDNIMLKMFNAVIKMSNTEPTCSMNRICQYNTKMINNMQTMFNTELICSMNMIKSATL